MRRRRQGSGSLFQNGRTWWMQYFVNGERKRQSTGCTERAAALDVLQRRLAELGLAKVYNVTPTHATIADLYRLVEADKRNRGSKDLQVTAWRWMAHLEKPLAKLEAGRLSSARIQAYIDSRQREGAANGTINRELSIVRRGFVLGSRAEPPLVVRTLHIPTLAEDNVRTGFIEQADYERLLEEVPGNLKALYVCAYHVGTRKGELRQTRWEQIDWEASLIRLPGKVTKNGRPRSLPIYGDMRRWLERQQATAPEGNPFVFHGRRKRPVSRALHGWAAACERAGLPGLYFHDLRRSAVRNMKRAGIPDKVAMMISGHRTRRVYERYDIVDESDFSLAGAKLETYATEVKKARQARLARVK